MNSNVVCKGIVIKALGNLVHVKFDGDIKQGGVAYIKVDNNTMLKSEVVEIVGDVAKVQVFEDTYGVYVGSEVLFDGSLVEVELGPGIFGQIFDGLQNPLNVLKSQCGLFLKRGYSHRPLSVEKKWQFYTIAKEGDIVSAGDSIGFVYEFGFKHIIFVPFVLHGKFKVKKVLVSNEFLSIDDIVAVIENSEGEIVNVTMSQKWPIKDKIRFAHKISPYEQLVTGIRVIDTLFPIMKGGTFCTPGPFGAGKTILQHHFTRCSNVDVVVIVACGERAGEIVQILEDIRNLKDIASDRPMLERTIVIGNTSSMPVAARESSVYTGVTIAEYLMHMGLHVLLLADSTSRWAQAMRELSGRLEEIPAEEAFPAYLGSRICQFYERSGAFLLKNGFTGTLTIGGTVSPSGGNFEEPVTQKTLSVAGAFLGLSRERASARKFPSIDPIISWSRYTDKVLRIHALDWFDQTVRTAIEIIKKGKDIEQRIEVVGEDGVAVSEFIIYLISDLFDFVFLQQNAFDLEDFYTKISKQMSLMKIMNIIFNKKFLFRTIEDTRNFFITIKSNCNALTYMQENSAEYKNLVDQIISKINNS